MKHLGVISQDELDHIKCVVSEGEITISSELKLLKAKRALPAPAASDFKYQDEPSNIIYVLKQDYEEQERNGKIYLVVNNKFIL